MDVVLLESAVSILFTPDRTLDYSCNMFLNNLLLKLNNLKKFLG